MRTETKQPNQQHNIKMTVTLNTNPQTSRLDLLWASRLLTASNAWDLWEYRDYELEMFPMLTNAFRRELNAAGFVKACEAYVRTGDEDALPYDWDRAGADVPDTLDARRDEVFEEAERLRHEAPAEGETVVDVRYSGDDARIGPYWRSLCRSSLVRRWLGGGTAFKAFERLNATLEAEGITFTQEAPLGENLRALSEAFELSETETSVLALLLLGTHDKTTLAWVLGKFDFRHGNVEALIDVLTAALRKPRAEFETLLSSDSNLMRSGLVSFEDGSWYNDFDDFVDWGIEHLERKLCSRRYTVEDLYAETFATLPAPTLTLADYASFPEVREVLFPFLGEALRSGLTGVNILFYGPPGTGKTELARLLAAQLGVKGLQICPKNDDSVLNRLNTAAQLTRKMRDAVIVVDEAEDVFNDWNGDLRTNKGLLNTLLETNAVPFIWTTNSLETIDAAMLRRFDVIIELAEPGCDARRRIVRKVCGDTLSEKTVLRLAATPALAPAVLTRAQKVAKVIGAEADERVLLRLVDATLRAQGHPPVAGESEILPAYYDPRFVACETDLEDLADGLARAGSGRLCLYGPPGTGKSAYAAWLAQRLGRPLIRQLASDLLSPWVGETEQRISQVFARARRENAVLLVDEADSFLRDRHGARASWEVTKVNEMLAQLERFDGIFVATTNLIDVVDAASIRRFDLKAKFGYLQPEQASLLAREVWSSLGFGFRDADLQRVRTLQYLTPGDFAAVARKIRFLSVRSAGAFVEHLEEELRLKLRALPQTSACASA